MILTVLTLAIPALARDRALLDGALNDSFKDRDQVQRRYNTNDLGVKSKRVSKQNRGIKIEVGDEFGPTVMNGTGGEEGLSFRGSSRGLEDIEVNVGQEIKDVNALVNKDLVRNPSMSLDGNE